MEKRQWVPVIVGALGYFVDIFDLVLFGTVRVASLRDLGVGEAEMMNVGVPLLNWQMGGMLLGGLLWGVLGDKKGRIRVLFGSIILYSLANLANAFVQTVEQYALLRFLAGIGLAGELGAAITLVTESLPQKYRGYGTAIVAAVGLSGGIAAGLTAEAIAWRHAYALGGGMGLLLLFLRIGLLESALFRSVSVQEKVRRGDLRMLFYPRARFVKYLSCILIGVPIWYVASILMTFAPEIGRELETETPLVAGKAIMFSYIGVAVGDLLTGWLSHWWKSRKKVVLAGMLLEAATVAVILFSRGLSAEVFYGLCVILGFSTGYWAVFVTIAAEQFGTNLRATTATSIPNFVRGAVVLITLSFKGLSQHFTLVNSALIVGSTTLVLGLLALRSLGETYSKDLNYLEK